MKKILVFISAGLMAFSFKSEAQLLYIDGVDIIAEPGAVITIQGGVEVVNAATIDNSGTIFVSGDFTNNSNGVIFTAGTQGTVIMDGAVQNIGGTAVTNFNNLYLQNTNTILTNDARVEDTLDIADSELDVAGNIMFVDNTDPNLLVWSNGFVSSTELGGYLARSTASTSIYNFPVGAGGIPGVYRGVSITPNNSNNNTYGVRLDDEDPSNETSTGMTFTGATGPFDRTQKSGAVTDIHDGFYHNIVRLDGSTPADVDVYYQAADGDFSTMAQWTTSNLWNTTSFNNGNAATSPFASANMVSTALDLNDFNYDVFALSNKLDIRIPEFISPERIDGKNDFLVIPDIEDFENNNIKIYNRWGALVYEKDRYDNTWDGKPNTGVDIISGSGFLPEGTYFYVLDLGVEDLEPFKGYVQIQN